MAKCKTIALLECLEAEHGELSSVISSALNIVEDINESGINPSAIQYLNTLVDEIYKAKGISLLNHLRAGAGADCQVCREMAKHIQVVAA